MVRLFSADHKGVGQGTEWIRSFLEKKGLKGRELTRSVLAVEETIGDLAEHAEKGSRIRIRIRSLPGSISIDFSAPGEEYNFIEDNTPVPDALWVDPDTDVENTIRKRILQAYMGNLRYSSKNGINKVRMTVSRQTGPLYLTLGALAAAIVLGVLLSMTAPAAVTSALDSNLLTPIKTMYMNGLKMLAAPVVFFSIATCISQMGTPADLGRIGGKILGMYMLTTVLAVAVGIGVFLLFRPGDASAAQILGSGAVSAAAKTMDVSLKSRIVGIVPDNFLSPFLESDMLQLIFLAVLCGGALNRIGDYSRTLQEIFEALNELFMRITTVLMHTTPIAVFCSILSLIMKTGLSAIVSLLGMIGTFVFGLVCMLAIYSLFLLIAGINPLQFVRKYMPVMLQVFSLAASNAAIPLNLDFCKEKMGISPRVYTFSIPLGATINMDGMCVMLAVQALTLAKIYGVDVPAEMLLPLAVSIICLSIGSPGVPGAGLIMVSMLVIQLGVPVESVALVIGIGPLMGMFMSASNCLGDVVVTTVVAKTEKMISK